MATNNPDIFQTLLKSLSELLQPVLLVFSDKSAKVELLESLGLNSDVDTATLPSTTNLEQYIAAEAKEADEILLIGAMSDLTQLMLAIEGLIRAAIRAGNGDEQALDEILNSLMTALLTEYARRKSPGFYAFINLISTLTEQTAANGGIINFFNDVIVDFFRRLWGLDLKTEENAAAISESVFMCFASLMLFIQECLLSDEVRDVLAFEMAYGYEGITQAKGMPAILADKISNRSLSYKAGITPFDKPDNQLTFYNTFAFIPEIHGGPAFISNLSGDASYTLGINDRTSLKFDVSGNGISRIDTSASSSAGGNNKIAITLKYDRKDDELLKKIFHTPEIKIGLKEGSISLSVIPNDFEIKLSGKLPVKIKRSEDAFFPLRLLPKEIEEEIPLALGYSLKKGFFFGNGGGSAGSPAEGNTADNDSSSNITAEIAEKILNLIDLRIPINEDISGAVGIQALNLKTFTSSGFDIIKLEISLDFWLKFSSAVTLSISRLGAEMQIQKRDDSGGVLGYDVTPKFKSPDGAGIRVNARCIKGGGFLYLDAEKGEYSGSLELVFKKRIALKAIGIINTVMPDASNGFSMLILITSEFSAKPLGLGFKLQGAGGLLGIDRKANVEALRIGIRTNAIKSLLFPEDVVGNISRIINDIRTIFPVQKDVFIIGLMAQLSWGEKPALITIELGLMIELPNPVIMLLGVIKTSQPDENAAIFKLQANFLGAIDFTNKFIYFEAQLFESELAGFALTGSLACVTAWGDDDIFAISIGGFHPDFKDYPIVPTLPGAFRNMARVGIALINRKKTRLTIECYLAITPNTKQIGGKLELLASGPRKFNLYGMLSLDAIFFTPGILSLKVSGFDATIEATLAIRRKRTILFGISLKARLSGTSPWRIAGSVSFGILFFHATIPVNETWGDAQEATPATAIDLRKLLSEELANLANWRSLISVSLHNNITLKEREAEDSELIIDPVGELQFSQQLLPLDYDIEIYGRQRPLNDRKFSITQVQINAQPQNIRPLKESFAAGNFSQLSEREKLTRKSFEKLNSGFTLEDSARLQTAEPHLPPIALHYELSYTRDNGHDPGIITLPLKLFKRKVRSAAVAKSPLSWAASDLNILNNTEELQTTESTYAIANTSNLKARSPELKATNRSEINAIYNELITENPELEDEIQIVKTYELAS